MEVELTFALRFTCDHVLFEVLWVRPFAAVDVHVVHDRTFEVVIELSPTLVSGCSLIVFPRGVVVSFVLPFDLLRSSQNNMMLGLGVDTYQVLEVLLVSVYRVEICGLLAQSMASASGCLPGSASR